MGPRQSAGRRGRGGSAGVVLAAWLLAMGGCGDGGPDGSGEPVRHLLDRAHEGTLHLARTPDPPRVLLDDAASREWTPVTRMLEELTPEQHADLGAHSRVTDSGEVLLGSEGGAWTTLTGVPPDTWLRLSATVTATGVPVDDAPGARPRGAQLVVSELTHRPDEGARPGVGSLGRARTYHASPARGGPLDGERLELRLRTGPDTRGAILACAQSLPGSHDGARTVFTDVTLVVEDEHDRLARLGGVTTPLRDGAAPPVGRFAIGSLERPGVVLPRDGVVVLPLEAPAGPSRFAAHVGVVPEPEGVRGMEVTFTAVLRAEESSEPLASWSRRVVTAGPRAARWHALGGDLPPGAAGRALRVELRLQAPPDFDAVALMADPRVIPSRPRRPGPNLVIVSLDTLRADRVGAYGYGRDTTPALDALAARGQLFTDCWAQGPYTLSSHMSLFSGQYPSVHGVQGVADALDPARTRLLAPRLREAGWATAAFTGGGYLSADFGFNAGFDLYSTLDPGVNLESPRIARMLDGSHELDAAQFAAGGPEAIGDWLEEHAAQSFFLFVHTYAAHEFDPPQRLLDALDLDVPTREEAGVEYWLHEFETPPAWAQQRLDALYDGGVRQADEVLGAVTAALARLDLERDTLVVVVSDHGKELGEHGLVAHGHSLYEEMLQVPLVLALPGRAPARWEHPVMLVDVLPTVLSELGLDLEAAGVGAGAGPAAVQGRDLFDASPRELFAEVDDLAVKAARRQGDHKTIWSPPDVEAFVANDVEEQSFDLGSDPGEQHPLPPDPSRAEAVQAAWAAWRALSRELAGSGGGGRPGAASPVSRRTRERLRELGYLRDGDG